MRELRTAVRVDVPQSVEYVELCIDAYAHVLLLGSGTLVRVRVEAETVVVVVAGRCAKGWQESAPCVCLVHFCKRYVLGSLFDAYIVFECVFDALLHRGFAGKRVFLLLCPGKSRQECNSGNQ